MSDLSTRPTGDGFTRVTARGDDRSWEVTVEGELDLSAADVLHEAMGTAGAAARVVVDVGGVTFLDCGGLRALLSAVGDGDTQVWLRSPSPAVRRFAELAGLLQEWPEISSDGEVRIA